MSGRGVRSGGCWVQDEITSKRAGSNDLFTCAEYPGPGVAGSPPVPWAAMSPSLRSGGDWVKRGLALATATAILIGGCSEPRMSLTNWEQVWEQTVDRVARVEAAEVPEDECSDLLTYLRMQRPRLDPSPVEGLEKPVDAWFELAEAAFFECPPDNEAVSGWAEAFERLSVLEAEVATVLARSPGS